MRYGVAAALGAAMLTTAVALQAPSGSDHRRVVPAAPTPVPVASHRVSAFRALTPFRVEYRDLVRSRQRPVRVLRLTYTANGGRRRIAYVEIPRRDDALDQRALPLVIAVHGRGISARENLNYWGDLPALGPFVLVDPEGQGRRLADYSWGWPGQIDDLARMPALVERDVPEVRVDPRRIYAIGSSMGGQETLLLVARHPRLLAGAAALDSATDMRARYVAFADMRGGSRLRRLARFEIGGTPSQVSRAYLARSPIAYARRIAWSGVPLQMWWSTRDRIVRNQSAESGALYRAIMRSNPHAPVTKLVGTWAHSREMHPLTRLPLLLSRMGLIRLGRPVAQEVVRAMPGSRAAVHPVRSRGA